MAHLIVQDVSGKLWKVSLKEVDLEAGLESLGQLEERGADNCKCHVS